MRKLSALFILIVVFIPLAFAAMTLTSIRPWVLDRGFYERIINDERLYETLLTDEMPTRFNRDTFTESEQLPVAALGSALRQVVTPDYLRAQSLHVVDKLFDYLEGRDQDFELAVDITSLKAALAGEAKQPFSEALAAALPACEVGQQPIAPGGRLTRCIATDTSVNAAAQQIAAALPAVLENTPDQIVLNDGTPYIRMNWYNFGWPFVTSVTAGLDVSIVTIVVIALAVGVVGAYIGGDDLRGRLKWFSSSLFFPASLFLFIGLALTSPYLAAPISRSMASVRYSEAFREAVTAVTIQVVQQLGTGILLTGGATFLIALALLVWSWATPASSQKSPRIVQVPVRNS